MDRFSLRLFHAEVETQCRFVLLAYEDLQKATDVHRVWLALQTILVSAANISKLCWGSGGKHKQERQPLRAELGLDDSSSLRDPDLRNDFEHFDVRLKNRKDRDVFVGRNVGPPDMIGGGDPAGRFGHYDPQTGVVTFWEHSVSIPDIVAEARRLLPVAQDGAARW